MIAPPGFYNLVFAVAVGLGLFFSAACGLWGGEPSGVFPSNPAPEIYPLILAKFERPEVREELAGSRRAVLTFARADGERAIPLNQEDFEMLQKKAPQWRARAFERADLLLQTAEKSELRDRLGVLQAIVLESPHPCFSGVIFSQKLMEEFEAALGPEMLAAVPRQGLVVLFPGADARVEALAEFLLGEYRRSGNPVSEEIYRLKKGGLTTEGILRD